jgi:hypothetical protein
MSAPNFRENKSVKARIHMMATALEGEAEFEKNLHTWFGIFATELITSAPLHCETGRIIAALDLMRQAQHTFSDAEKLGFQLLTGQQQLELLRQKEQAAVDTDEENKKRKAEAVE